MTFDPLPDKPSIIVANSLKKFFSSGLNTEEDSEFSKTIQWLLSEHDNLIKTTEDIYKSKFIDTAYGQSLDNIGYLVNCQRKPQEEDVFYRTRIKLAIAVRNSSGTKKDLLNILSILTKIPSEENKFNILEQPELGMAYPNAAFAIEMETAFESEMYIRDLKEIINQAKAASVYFGELIFTYNADTPDLTPPFPAGSIPYVMYMPLDVLVSVNPIIIPDNHTGYNVGGYNTSPYSIYAVPYGTLYPYISSYAPAPETFMYNIHPGYNVGGYNEFRFTYHPNPEHCSYIQQIFLHYPKESLCPSTTGYSNHLWTGQGTSPTIHALNPHSVQKGYNIGTYNEHPYALASIPDSTIYRSYSISKSIINIPVNSEEKYNNTPYNSTPYEILSIPESEIIMIASS